jgi:hypothetical protein
MFFFFIFYLFSSTKYENSMKEQFLCVPALETIGGGGGGENGLEDEYRGNNLYKYI